MWGFNIVIDQLAYQIAIDTARFAPLSEQQADARIYFIRRA